MEKKSKKADAHLYPTERNLYANLGQFIELCSEAYAIRAKRHQADSVLQIDVTSPVNMGQTKQPTQRVV